MAYKILVADDEPAIVQLLASRLKANNYSVVVAYDGVQAVNMAHIEKPDLIILDIKMPAGTGVTVYENLKMSVNTATIPVIFITAYPNEDIEEKVLKMGAKYFISKPFDSEDLLDKVKIVLGEA
jgi:DNA-binding response OmpR family regulator